MVKTVILVEDCKKTLDMTKFVLSKLGIKNFFTATNENEFNELLRTSIAPDLIITDWNIGENFKGATVIEAMSKFDKPIAVVSSEQQKEIFYEKQEWFKKPLNINQLSDWLKKFYP